MKKVALVVLSSVAALYATSVTVNTGWNLLGAINGISPSQITCASTVWTYDPSDAKSWKLYVKTPVSGNYGFNTIPAINMGQGFWVNNTSGSPCILEFNTTTPVTGTYYDAYGFHFIDVKKDARYTVANNHVSYNSSTTTFDLNASLSAGIDSRAQLTADLTSPLSAINATTKLVTGTTGYNKSQVIIGNLDINSTTAVGYAGINLNKNGATAWFETNNISTGETIQQFYSHSFSTTNMVGENIISHIDVNGSKITYSISNGSTINASDTYTTTANGITIGGGIKRVGIRARTDDSNATTTPGSVTTVQFSNLQATPYTGNISSTPATTLNFADLSSFIMFDGQGKGYTKVTKSASTFSATDYDYNGTTWAPNSGPSGTVSGNRITFSTTGAVYEFAILGTQKVNSALGVNFTDLYMSQATTTCVTAPSTFEYDVWTWDNPTYYNSSTSQQVPITNLTTLVAGFTAPDQGMRFGNDAAPMFLNANNTVVTGIWDGTYYSGCTSGDCRKFTRTTTVVGSWTSDSSKIYVEVPKQSMTFEVVNQSGIYRIQEGWKDKVGGVDNQFIFSGTEAIDAVVQTYLSSQQPTAN